MKHHIKGFFCYQATAMIPPDEIAVKAKAFIPPMELESQSAGVVSHKLCAPEFAPSHNTTVAIRGNLIAYCVRIDKKTVPASAIQQKAAAMTPLDATKKERRAIKEQAELELLKTAPCATTFVNAYWLENRRLFICTTNKAHLSACLAVILGDLDVVKTETYHVNGDTNGIDARMRTYLENGSGGFAPFVVNEGEEGSYAELTAKDGGRKLVLKSGEGVITNWWRDAIKSAMREGHKLTALRLYHEGTSFVLKSNFAIQGIAHAENALALTEHSDELDEIFEEVHRVDEIVSDLVEMVKPDPQPEPEPTE